MPDKKITELAELASIVEANEYWFEIVDMSEVLATNRNKRVSEETLKSYFNAGGSVIESTFTPVTSFITPAVSDGYYLKNGRIATIQFDITWPLTSDTNQAIISGWPTTLKPLTDPGGSYVTIYNGSLFYFDIGVGSNNPVTTAMITMLAIGDGSIYLRQSAATGTSGYINNATLSQRRVIGTITYITAT